MRGLIAKKVGMSQIFDDDGSVVPVTILQAGPCSVAQVKTVDNDGYDAVQIAYGDKKAVSYTHLTLPTSDLV